LTDLQGSIHGLEIKVCNNEVAMSLGIVASLLAGELLAAGVITFFTLAAEFIDELTIDRGRAAIRELIEISPRKAIVRREGREIEVPVSEVLRGDTV
ncbi:cation-transporting P-type ATPase, partial [Candidatus Bathyarchaeota archaeon]|nr:cation-transporting P-type ATPase [Candidatus Bathyarchaeota archaeon]